MTGKTIGIIVAVLIVIGGGIWYFMGSAPAAPAQQATDTASTTPDATGGAQPGRLAAMVVVHYTDSGFSPASLNIVEGQTVNFVNESSHPLWLASDPHPSHTGYDGTSRTTHCAAGYSGPAPLDSCKALGAGESFAFTFSKVGSWGYHNHSVDEDRGTVIVSSASGTGANVQVQVQ